VRYDPLPAYDALECRYDGHIPQHLRLAARLGSAASVRMLHAEGQAAFFTAMARGQLRAIRRRRADGSFYPSMLADLALYRRERRRWRRIAAAARHLAPATESR
jgi:hypothetical protein